MFLDALCQLSDSQAITADAVSTNAFDAGSMSPIGQLGDGEEMSIVVNVEVAADFTTGDETYQFEVITDDAAALSSPTVRAAYLRAASVLTAGSIHIFPVPPGAMLERYVGMNYNVGGTTPTITVSAHLMPTKLAQRWQAYADGFTIS